MQKALIVSSRGTWYTVKSEDGKLYQARLRGAYRLKGSKSTSPLVVGDWVEFELKGEDVVISELLQRKNFVVRKSVNLSKQTHILAANVDYAFLVVTVSLPETSLAFIDRFLAACTAYNITAVLLFNKTDLYDSQTKFYQEALAFMYEKIGYKSLIVSAETGLGLAELRELMSENISMFAGHSGVGKSTLINRIEPNLNIKTSNISLSHMQGKHTTTFAQMHFLSLGGAVIDTPGIRGFGLSELSPDEIDSFFPDIFAYKSKCKFYNCLHDNEPDCAVKKAVEKAELSESRYISYLSILHQEEGPYRNGAK